jgi:uncharacterized protein (TIGR00369 family)
VVPDEAIPESDPRHWARPAQEQNTGRIPYHALLGIWPREVAGGKSRVELTIEPHHLRAGTISHGGVFASLLDSAQGMAAASMARPGFDVVTAQLGVNFVRPAVVGDTLIATAEVQHAGRRTAVTRAEIRSPEGALFATGTATLLYLPIEGGS